MSKLSKYLYRITPPELRFKLVSIKHTLSKFKQVHYSQNGEDIILKSEFPRGYKGFYVDVGAHHPYRISNTYKLFKAGWRGMNIDANPKTITLFKHARPKDINLNVGVGKEVLKATYHQFADPAVNTFSDAEARKWKNHPQNTYLGTVDVDILPLKEIFDTHVPHDTKIDLLNVDVEGLDLSVLQSNDWQKYSPTVVIVEDHTFSIDTMNGNPIYLFMKTHGYTLEHKLKFTLIFKKKKSR